MNAAEFFELVKTKDIRVDLNHSASSSPASLSNEAMFHLPLIAITILAIAKGQTKPVVDEIGQLVGDCFERVFPIFRGSAQHLGWSASLRVRTVQALSFLETARLVEIDEQGRRLSTTLLGKAVVSRAYLAKNDLTSTLVAVERSYRNIRTERQMRLSPQ